MEALIELVKLGWNIKIWNQPKRMDDGRGYRDFVVRVCWEAQLNDHES